MTIQTSSHTNGASGLNACHCPIPSDPTQLTARMEGGKAVIENANVRITCGDDNQVLIENKHNGETTRIWGDPHVEVDGKQAFDFWGQTSFQLEDGTKITIETTPWNQDAKATLASRVTVTNGDSGVQVSGVDTNKTGDLRIDEAGHWGGLLDTVVDDGNVLYENPAGAGFVAVDPKTGGLRQVDQDYINRTDLLKGGAERCLDRFDGLFAQLPVLLSMSFYGSFLSGFEQGYSDAYRGGHHDGGHGDDDRPIFQLPPPHVHLCCRRYDPHC